MRLQPKKSQRAETEIHPPKAGISSIKREEYFHSLAETTGTLICLSLGPEAGV